MITLDNITWPWQPQPMRFTFSAAAGERIAILGPSGAGKSTLLSLIAGFLSPSHGEMTLNGVSQDGVPPARRPVSMLFQENNLFTHLTARENIALGVNPGLRLTPDQRKQVEEIAGQVGLDGLLARLPETLSGGQRQRVALARCLIRRQPILLLDEPFSALDPALRREMLALLDQQCALRNMTLLMVSHTLEDAARLAPRSLVVAQGEIAWDGPTQQLLLGKSPAARWLGIAESRSVNPDESPAR